MPVVIVGAGLSGLTVAHELASRGQAVTVVERGDAVGGLARTFRYGEFSFDVGPHRLHTTDGDVSAFIGSILPTKLLSISRASAVRAFGRLLRWPLSAADLVSLPLSLVARSAVDACRRERLPGDSFEAEIVNRYGRALYETFFRPYTARFLGMDPRLVHRDWARAGIDRAIIDGRQRADGLWQLLWSTLAPRGPETTFLYPAGGIDRLANRLAERVTGAGGRVLLGQPVTGVETSGDRIVAVVRGRERIAASRVVWTAPVTLLADLTGMPHGGLEFLSTVLYNVELRAPSLLRHQWVYYGGAESFVRVSSPALFSLAAVPRGKGSLCVEVSCREGAPSWLGAERGVGEVVDDLVRVCAIASAREVEAVRVERIPDSYPIYSLGYREELGRVLEQLGRYRNLLLLGRGGRFWYNNMDHSIAQALAAASRFTGDDVADIDLGAREFWAASRRGTAARLTGAATPPRPR